MCDLCAPPPPPVTRRVVLGSAAAGAVLASAVGAGWLESGAAGATPGAGPVIRPRDAWGSGLAPTGPLEVEGTGDVRVLLVHHTAGPNDYGAGDVPGLLQGIYRFHTGPEKGWPDVAYNFFVDRYGGIWEGRSGSIAAPVKGDATGGSQGFALLCCFLGTHTETPPTAEAQVAMIDLLAWLAARYLIDTSPGATTSFVSRGSSNHPAGTTVTTSTIAGHRDMSATTCPGDAAYGLVTTTFPAAVTARRAALGAALAPAPPPPPTSPVEPTPAAPPPPTTAGPETVPVASTTTGPPEAPASAPPDPTRRPASPTEAASAVASEGGGPSAGPIVGGAALAAAVLAGGVVALRRRRSEPGDDDSPGAAAT